MFDRQIPFRFLPVSGGSIPFSDGQIISTINLCGVFLCLKGEVEVTLDKEKYQIRQGDLYIYMPSTLVRIQHKSTDADGVLIEADLNFIIPIANRAMNAENLLYIRQHPCVSLSQEQCSHLERLLVDLRCRIEAESFGGMTSQRRHLMVELLKSMGQTLCYEVLNAYFANRPLTPLPPRKKDLVFQNFQLALFRHYRRQRDVAFYASMQHLAPRYFSTIIKEKSGSTPLQWIVQMVITEAKQLLEESNLSIKEIAARLNFPTQSFFGKYFKQYTGISPKEYRAQRKM